MNQKKVGNSTTPVRNATDSEHAESREKRITPAMLATTEKLQDPNPGEVMALVSEVRRLTEVITSLSSRLEEATQSLAKCQSRLDEFGFILETSNTRLKKLEERDLEILELKATVAQLKSGQNTRDQYYLRNEIEISGIPENPNENLHHVALIAARKIGVDLEEREIDWIQRVGPRRNSAKTAEESTKPPRPVVMRFLRCSKKQEILKAARSRRNLTSVDLEVSGAPLKVFFNERLTKENRLLFRDVRIKRRENNFAHCWVSQGTIYVRQKEGKPALPIHSSDDLDRVFGVSVA